jgi:hypothetical protein
MCRSNICENTEGIERLIVEEGLEGVQTFGGKQNDSGHVYVLSDGWNIVRMDNRSVQ